MKKRFLSLRALVSAGSAALLTALGFGSCNEVDMGPAEYGTPTVHYKLKLKVVDQEDKPVSGLELSSMGSTKLSDAEGKAELEGSGVGFYRDHEVTVQIKDVDGAANGVVADEVRTVKVTKSDFADHDKKGWDNGTVHKEVELKVERK